MPDPPLTAIHSVIGIKLVTVNTYVYSILAIHTGKL